MLILGAGGLATQITDLIQRIQPDISIVYYDETIMESQNLSKFGFPIINSEEELLRRQRLDQQDIVIGIANGEVKRRLFTMLHENGLSPATLIAQSALIAKNDVIIKDGTVIMEHCIVESNTHIGKCCLLNTATKIFHDSTLGDFCEIAPNVSILGRCTIGNNVFIGAGATLLPGIEVKDHAIIGAGSIVTKNVSAHQIVKGNPAK